ncbi:cyclic nucleotide-binding protein [Haloprofundus marisrubri]|uniref:Cyclic nucleotide-binding protein n=1 Tax=Haloprofundus marisrubri TaxID=1514971 RepID=A0A0W1R5P8_9EURY|nr:cupin domain-containing protein [Haloprofundus marisrubri]KTG08713.1 cyclic nucleotide-binding protein [Haloprofundus marisrubri]
MYSRINLADVDAVDSERSDARVKPVGYHLRPSEMRPNVWTFDAGESTPYHYQEEQEELYVVLDGRFELDIEDETLELEADDYVVVSPEAKRQLTAVEAGTALVVGAPNVKDDGVVLDEE